MAYIYSELLFVFCVSFKNIQIRYLNICMSAFQSVFFLSVHSGSQFSAVLSVLGLSGLRVVASSFTALVSFFGSCCLSEVTDCGR